MQHSSERGHSNPIQLDVNLWDPDLFHIQGYPHAAFKTLREQCPVYWQEWEDGGGFWVITKHADIRAISCNPKVFSSALGGSNIEDYEEPDISAIRMMMINMDPPRHHQIRRLVRQGFTPRMVKLLEPAIRTMVDDLVGKACAKGKIDFVNEIAAILPLGVICEMLGVDKDNWQTIFDLSNRLIGFDDPEFQTSLEDGRIAAMEMWRFADEIAEKHRGNPSDSIVSVLVNAEIDGQKIELPEFVSFFLLLSVAGNETTRNAISHGLLALLEHPDQFERLRNDRSLLPTFVEEILRWNPPVMYFRRTATEDVEVRGQLIKKGEKLAMYYGSANRDADIFDDPQTFDIGRTPNDHLAFGVGEHFCLGSSLARLEITCLYEKILDHMHDIELDGPIRKLRSNFINGIKSLPIKFRAA